MKRIAAIIFLLTFFAYISEAQVDRSKKPEPGPAPEIKIGDYESFQLENGLKVFVVENHKMPRVTFSLVLDIDPVLEGEDAGYVSFAGQLLRTGTKNRSKSQIDEDIDFIGANLSTAPTGINAGCLSQHTEKLVEIISDIILNAEFKQNELDKIRKQTISGLAAEKDDPNAIAGNVGQALTYGLDHPYGEQLTEASVEKITLEMCSDYYNSYFKPNIAYLSIVGDITKDDAEDLIEQYLGKWQRGDVPKHEYKKPRTPLVNKVAIVDRPNSVQSVIHITYPIDLKRGSEDVIKASLCNTILGGSFSSRLMQNLREDKGYTYGARSSLISDELVGRFDASCQARNIVTDSAITEFLNEMKKLRSEKVGEDELQSMKNYLTGTFSRSLENPQTIANFAINIERYGLPKDYYKNYLKNLQAVTSDDIQQMAKKYIKPNNAYILVVGNADEIAEKLKSFSVSRKIDYYDIYGNEYDPSVKKIPEGITVESVIEKYINALGGKENMEKIKDRVITMKGNVQGMDITVTLSQKIPNKFLMDLDVGGGMMKQKVVFDGEKGKTSGMGQEEMMEGDDLEEMKIQATMFEVLYYEKYGIKTELKGIETIGGKDAYKVAITYPSGKQGTDYFDVNTGLKIRELKTQQSQQGTVTQTVDFDDYREVEGVKTAYKLTQSFGPQSVPLEVVSIQVNSGLDDSVFEVK